MAKKAPVDPLESAQYGLHGIIVTMTAEDAIIKGTIFIKSARIEAIIPDGEPVPANLKDFPVYKTKGTIFPGLIELHNHLSYNCLPLWKVPKQYGNRSQWSGIHEYQLLISTPMNILGKAKGYVEAIVRYVECKCLAGGVTTSQGIMLFSNAGIRKYYRGIVRNVESTDDPDLPAVDAHIPDIAAKDVEKFAKQLQKASCLLLHLSEGRDDKAHKHFEALRLNDTDWAIAPSLAGIHCVALKAEDYKVMKQKGASMVWSPLSNLLLYGQTADIKSAKASGITIGLGSDWSPSGSKNLFGELKVAKLFSDENGGLFSDYELVAMATKNPATIIKWDKELGTLEKGKRADLLVISKQTNDHYRTLLTASEEQIGLVVVNGGPRFGDGAIMTKFEGVTEKKKIGTKYKLFNLQQATQDPVVGQLKLSAAEEKLKKALKNLGDIAEKQPGFFKAKSAKGITLLFPDDARAKAAQPEWVLVLDHNEEEGEPMRTHFTVDGEPSMPFKKMPPMALRPEDLVPIQLDPLTVANDTAFFDKLKEQINLPDFIKTKLKKMYGG
jgi:cytosine/adenosine deaminase-related metal-dependent hydrolase